MLSCRIAEATNCAGGLSNERRIEPHRVAVMRDLDHGIFRAYDIRGTAPGQLDAAAAREIGNRFANWLLAEGATAVAVGRDPRSTSPNLHEAAIEGILAAGLNVHVAGLAPTPVVTWAASEMGPRTAALIVTASHNPPEFNGFKLIGPESRPLLPEDIQAVAYASGTASPARGSCLPLDANNQWLEMIAARFGGTADGLHVAIDPGNGATSPTGGPALQAAGARVSAINAVARPDAPNHLADPQDAETMRPLARLVAVQRADLGIAWDGDGDRIGTVDHLGRRPEADWIAAVLARPHLARNRGALILVDAKSSTSIAEDIAARGGEPLTARTGYSFFRRRMRDEGIQFGGEASGHVMFGPEYAPNEPYPFLDDGVYAACALLRHLARSGSSLHQELAQIRPRPISPELRLPCPDARKAAVAASIGDRFAAKHQVVREDGARILFTDGWAHARASNTAPALSLRFEADDESAYRQIAEQLAEALTAHPEVAGTDQLAQPPALGPQSLL